jgi:hypothetical protein
MRQRRACAGRSERFVRVERTLLSAAFAFDPRLPMDWVISEPVVIRPGFRTGTRSVLLLRV